MLYADYNATSPLSAGVADAMQPYLGSQFGNPSSTFHELGAHAHRVVEQAREQVAQLVGAKPEEVVFVSGGTESCAHALIGAARAMSSQCRVVYSAVEHLAVHEAVAFLQEFRGCKTSELTVNGNGALDADLLYKECGTSREVIVSLMSANNETGVLFPIDRLARQCRAGRVGKNDALIFHTDAVQLVGKATVDFSSLPVDILSVSAHKFGGPKGIGALVIRDGVSWQPVVRGGGQESGRRGGTEAVAHIVGMGEAARIRREQLADGSWERVGRLREQFEQQLLQQVSDVRIHGSTEPRLSNTSSVLISGTNSKRLRSELAEQGVVIASGSACFASQISPSHVLRAMGQSIFDCLATIRVSFGIGSSEQEVEQLVALLARKVERQRSSAEELISQRLVANTKS